MTRWVLRVRTVVAHEWREHSTYDRKEEAIGFAVALNSLGYDVCVWKLDQEVVFKRSPEDAQ